jgi:hypothetical protein
MIWHLRLYVRSGKLIKVSFMTKAFVYSCRVKARIFTACTRTRSERLAVPIRDCIKTD